MTDKDKLYKLLGLFESLLNIDGNEWFLDELLRTVNNKTSIQELANNAILNNIHELCVEARIKKQAEEFYKSFPYKDIKPRLILDHIKMEHERRRDDFEGFALSVYQQVEAIVNYLFESENTRAKLKYDKEFNLSAFLEWDSEQKEYRRTSYKKVIPTLLRELKESDIDKYFENDNLPVIRYSKDKNTWDAARRYRTILFYNYFNGEVKKSDFDNTCLELDELYAIRNMNHRGRNMNDLQKKIFNRKYKYYFKYYSILEKLVSRIEDNYSQSTLDEYIKHSIILRDGVSATQISNTFSDDPIISNKLLELKRQIVQDKVSE
jgi:hypothetical protein